MKPYCKVSFSLYKNPLNLWNVATPYGFWTKSKLKSGSLPYDLVLIFRVKPHKTASRTQEIWLKEKRRCYWRFMFDVNIIKKCPRRHVKSVINVILLHFRFQHKIIDVNWITLLTSHLGRSQYNDPSVFSSLAGDSVGRALHRDANFHFLEKGHVHVTLDEISNVTYTEVVRKGIIGQIRNNRKSFNRKKNDNIIWL